MLAGAVIASLFAIAFLLAAHARSDRVSQTIHGPGLVRARGRRHHRVAGVAGVFSPAPVVLVLGVYFTGLGKSGRLAAMVYATCAGMQGLVGGLVIAGLHDNGSVHVDNLALRDRCGDRACSCSSCCSRRLSPRACRDAPRWSRSAGPQRAVRIAAHREALLLEAREELERALRPGRGRFSDWTISGYQLGALLGRGAMGEVYGATGPRKVLSRSSCCRRPRSAIRIM